MVTYFSVYNSNRLNFSSYFLTNINNMKKLYFFDSNNQMILIQENRIVIDGYDFDENLEGVKFEISFDKNDVLVIKINEEDKNILENLNKINYMEDCRQYICENVLTNKYNYEPLLPKDLQEKYNCKKGFLTMYDTPPPYNITVEIKKQSWLNKFLNKF